MKEQAHRQRQHPEPPSIAPEWMSRKFDDGRLDQREQPIGCLPFMFWTLLAGFVLIAAALGISECIRFCGCTAPTNVDEARADLERQIELTPRRFTMTTRPQQLEMTPLPAGDQISSQGGWFFEVIFGPDDSRKMLYVTNFAAGATTFLLVGNA